MLIRVKGYRPNNDINNYLKNKPKFMKRIIYSIVASVMFLFLTVAIRHFSIKKTDLSSLLIDNIEALTDTELPEITITCSSGPDGKCYKRVHRIITSPGHYANWDCEYTGSPNDACKKPFYF